MTACEELEATATPHPGASARSAIDDNSARSPSTTSSGPSPTSRLTAPSSWSTTRTWENEGDIIFAAQAATPELLAFMVRYTSGVICVPLPGLDLNRLRACR